ncbi:MAG: hypothetical protein KME40_32070 [Komarekiella atlantica HA4396-MV6]|jgi:hypothetical protein|nr:hypothetical protein [Komarekiella atlantica HA4396-MV6]
MKKKVRSNPFWRNPVTGQCYSPGTSIPLIQRKKLEHWDSALEFETYCKLRARFKTARIIRQEELTLLPKTLCFSELTWKVDFMLVSSSQDILYVETKGQWILHDKSAMSDFCKTLRILENQQPKIFHSLVVVSDSSFRIAGSNIFTTRIKEIETLRFA